MSKAELLAYIESLPAAKLAELEAIVAGMTAETSASGPSLSRKEIDALRLSLFERYGYFDSTAAIRELRDNGPRQLRYVIDASVAAKWLLPETDSSAALTVLDAAQASRIALVAPALIGLEFGHVLGKELRRGRCDPATAERLWSAFRGLPIALVSARLLQDRAFLLSVTRRITMYDALYVAVAEAEGVPLITADAGLIAAVSASDNRIIHMDAVSL